MRLFDEVPSFGDRTILYDELDFDYFQGSGRPEMIRVKELLESWFAEYPNEHKQKLRQNLRGDEKKRKPDKRQRNFHQAFFELYIYTLLRRLGCQVEIEPSIVHLEGKNTRPDFLATHQATGYSFYVEATVQGKRGAEKKEDFLTLLKAELDKIPSPDFVICIDRFRILEKGWTPSTERLMRYVNLRLLAVHADPSPQNMKPRAFQGLGWKLSFYFESRAEQEGWVEPSRSLKETVSTRAVHSKENIRKAIKDKAGGRYGNLDHPFIIAVNVRDYLVNPQTVAEALYGTISHVYNKVKSESSPIPDLEFSHFEQKPNGSFRARGMQNTRVSAIWVASGLLCPTNIGSAKLYQFDNYFAEAQRKFVPPFPCLPRCYIDENGELAAMPGLAGQAILGIERDWPEGGPRPELDFSKWLGHGS